MKTNYESAEDIAYLRKFLSYAQMFTDRVFTNELMEPHIREYSKELLKHRKKVFEFLGEEDPNQQLCDLLATRYLS